MYTVNGVYVCKYKWGKYTRVVGAISLQVLIDIGMLC